jgi:hypothetical protein
MSARRVLVFRMSDPVTPPAGAPADTVGGAAPKKMMSPIAIVLIAVVGLIVVGGGAVVLIGVFGVRKYIAEAKAAEARVTVRLLATNAVEAQARRGGKFCPAASAPVPATVPKGVKYQSAASEWTADGTDAGFACLGYVASMPQYFQYVYEVEGDGSSPGDYFVVRAHGDLDGDGVTSVFSMRGKVNTPGTVVIDPQLTELRADE